VISFRGGFYSGLVIALCAGLYLIWLWQPERQVRRHTDNFFQAIEHKNWDAVADFAAADYQDQWGDDRLRVFERLREGLRYVRGPRISASNPSVQVEKPARGVERQSYALQLRRRRDGGARPTRQFTTISLRTGVASSLRQAMELEARASKQSGV